MTFPAFAYRGMISARSRRLRTIGLILLLAALGMALFGKFSLMPVVNRSISTQMRTVSSLKSPAPLPPQKEAEVSPLKEVTLQRARHIIMVQVLFAYAYWSVCGLLVLSLMLIAWLDLREVQRRFIEHQQALLREATKGLGKTESRE